MKKLLLLLLPLIMFSCEEEKELTLLDQLQGSWGILSTDCETSVIQPNSFTVSGSDVTVFNKTLSFTIENETRVVVEDNPVFFLDIININDSGLRCTYRIDTPPFHTCDMQFQKL